LNSLFVFLKMAGNVCACAVQGIGALKNGA